MWVRFDSIVFSLRNNAAASSRLVHPAATPSATRRSVAVSPFGLDATADAGELGSGALGPWRADDLEDPARLVQRVACSRFFIRRSDPRREVRPRQLERLREMLVP